ncbi:hypothetical protein B0H15DRAFT_567567 [Mycena belliarum]|uniref:Uncharacterized protein n=1 Tax=Mycena belliarum TaxID=1033014 RepID=A0AAD6TRR4_9AGAR|nr:hypothetical protein B0H15DRAFT_567567 [Mycena belliae]
MYKSWATSALSFTQPPTTHFAPRLPALSGPRPTFKLDVPTPPPTSALTVGPHRAHRHRATRCRDPHHIGFSARQVSGLLSTPPPLYRARQRRATRAQNRALDARRASRTNQSTMLARRPARCRTISSRSTSVLLGGAARARGAGSDTGIFRASGASPAFRIPCSPSLSARCFSHRRCRRALIQTRR